MASVIGVGRDTFLTPRPSAFPKVGESDNDERIVMKEIAIAVQRN
jgi:hypothetical protein